MQAIKTESLTKYYGKTRGIENLSLTVEEGDFFGFIGPNGAGKSTTIRTLLGLISPDSGKAEIFGQDIRTRRNEILSQIGFMPAEAAFYAGMRVSEVLRLSADLRGISCGDEAGLLCERLGLDVTRRVDELSLGNRKKVAIVCAMQHKPRLYIFDEPTSGLDPLVQHEFFELLSERSREGGTVFLSSHVLPEIQRHCNRAAIIRDGSLIACDSVEALTKTSAKRVIMRGRPSMDSLEGVRDLKINGETISFLYGGELASLLKMLASAEIRDLTITEPDMDEIFMHYYSGGDKA